MPRGSCFQAELFSLQGDGASDTIKHLLTHQCVILGCEGAV